MKYYERIKLLVFLLGALLSGSLFLVYCKQLLFLSKVDDDNDDDVCRSPKSVAELGISWQRWLGAGSSWQEQCVSDGGSFLSCEGARQMPYVMSSVMCVVSVGMLPVSYSCREVNIVVLLFRYCVCFAAVLIFIHITNAVVVVVVFSVQWTALSPAL